MKRRAARGRSVDRLRARDFRQRDAVYARAVERSEPRGRATGDTTVVASGRPRGPPRRGGVRPKPPNVSEEVRPTCLRSNPSALLSTRPADIGGLGLSQPPIGSSSVTSSRADYRCGTIGVELREPTRVPDAAVSRTGR